MASRGRIAIGELPRPRQGAELGHALCAWSTWTTRTSPTAIPASCWCAPTLFSGYWKAPEHEAEDFRDGWFHTGDVFARRADSRLDFVDRRKYLIKSGGENIYPAEIERLLLRSTAHRRCGRGAPPDDRTGAKCRWPSSCAIDPALTGD